MAEYIVESNESGSIPFTSNGVRTKEEIIRCRDCKHYKEVPYHDGTIRAQCSGVLLFVEPHPNGFCAWAERTGDKS